MARNMLLELLRQEFYLKFNELNILHRDLSIPDMPNKIKAGQITFHVTNIDSADTHSFIILKTDLDPGALPLDSSNNVDLTAQDLARIDGIDQLAPEAVQDLIVNLQPGNYVAICHLPGHYQAGMYAGFTVQ